MRIGENFPRPLATAPAFALCSASEEDVRSRISLKGEVFMTLRDGQTGDVQDERHLTNLVTLDASILIARLMKNNAEPPHGIYALAVGTGAIGWNVLSPPAPVNTERALWSEIARKTFASTQFINSAGAPVAIPTNVVDFTTTFAEAEAVGPLCEMGLLGGNLSSNMSIRNPVPSGPYDPTVDLTLYDTLVNVLNFAVISKPATSTLSITWRLSF